MWRGARRTRQQRSPETSALPARLVGGLGGGPACTAVTLQVASSLTLLGQTAL
jgi:hypothetical protein